MISYIEQIQILRDANRINLDKRVEEFSVGRCIKRTQYYRHPNTDLVETYEVYIWYTLPEEPTIELTASLNDNICTLVLTITCAIILTLKEVKVKYSTTENFSSYNTITFPNTYGTNSSILTINLDNTYYFEPNITTCMGTKTGNITIINN